MYKTVAKGECLECGNRWWFEMPNSYACTTCDAKLKKTEEDDE